MNQNLIDILDHALEQLRDGANPSSILAQFPSHSDDLMPLLETANALKLIQPVELPSPERQRQDRNRFLASIALAEMHPVSSPLLVRLQEQISAWTSQNITQPIKEKNKMSLIIFRMGLVFSMLVATAGGTVAMASTSLPDSALYPAKMLVEQINLNLQPDPAERAALHLVMAQERVHELVRLAEHGSIPGEPLMLKLEQHLNAALQLSLQLDDPGMAGVLEQARQMLQTQTRELARTRTQAGEPIEEPLRQAARILERVRQQVEYGMQDPNGFRSRVRYGQIGLPPNSCVDTPSTPGCEPTGEQHQYGPQPGAPGGNPDCPSNDCEPVGDQHQYGPQPELPGPGAPGGNPDCPSNDCEPVGDQHQYGPQPQQPGPGGPGGNPDCPSNDCEPVGDQHQNGPQPNDPGTGSSGGSGGSDNPGGSGGSGGRP